MEETKRHKRYIKYKFKDLEHFKEVKRLSDTAYRNRKRLAIMDKKNEKFTCECSGHYTLANRALHYKTNKHQNFLKSNNI
jgi:hypothetical protein